jgi:hypothetical protein
MNLDALKALADWMRSTGAVRAKVEGVELELGPALPYAPSPPAAELRDEPEPKCLCGHSLDQHGPAGCLAGCPMDLCVGSGQHPAPEEASE